MTTKGSIIVLVVDHKIATDIASLPTEGTSAQEARVFRALRSLLNMIERES